MKLLFVVSSLDLTQPFSATPAWWQLMKGLYEIGVGYSTSATSTYVKYWVQDFGRQPGVYPVIINHEAANTTSANVLLYIYGRGWAQEMRLSNDNRTWSDWEPFESIKSWTLAAGGGIRTVYVQLRSGATVLSADDTINLISAAAPASSHRPTPETSSMPLPTSGDQAQHFPEGLSAIRQAANAAGIIWGFIPAANPGTNRLPVSGRSGQPAGS